MMNRCFTYVLPCIADTLKIKRELLQNIYLSSTTFFNPEYIFLLFTYDLEYLEYLEQHIQVEEIQIKDNLIVKFKLNTWQKEINSLYLHGKYSEFPDSYKTSIMRYHNLSKTSKQFQILYKLPILRQKLESELKIKLESTAELGIKTNIKEETLDG